MEDNCSITLGGLKAMKSDTKFRKAKSLDQLLEIDEAARATRSFRRSGTERHVLEFTTHPVIHLRYSRAVVTCAHLGLLISIHQFRASTASILLS